MRPIRTILTHKTEDSESNPIGTLCPWAMAWGGPANPMIIPCRLADHPGAADHEGKLHQTTVTWMDGDRRCFKGEFPGWCAKTPGCVLPAGHHGRCAT